MGTSTFSLGGSSNSPFSPVTLNGVSQYSSDLQSVLNRAVAIAQIPITRLQNRDSTVLSQEGALGQLQSTVQGLAASLTSLGKLASGQALTANSSNASVATATATGATAPATYMINSVTSVASAASENSLAPYATSTGTPVSPNGSMQLVVGSNNYDFTLGAGQNNLNGLANQINSLNAGVTASVLTTANGDYLAVSANATGATTLQLIDDPGGTGHANTQWLTNQNQGSNADFSLNGIEVRQASNTINNVVPGLTFNIQTKSTSPVTLTLASDPTQLTSALQNLVTNYNSLRTALSAQEGPAAGVLSGDTSVIQLEGAMSRLTGYTNIGGSIQSLSDLGITFGSNGQASFDPNAVSGFTDAQLSAAFQFIGSATSGWVGTSQTFQQFGDPTNGLLGVEAKGLASADQTLQAHITTLTNHLTVMQKSLAAQLSSADALLAELQSQQTSVTASIQGLNLVLYGRNTSTA